MLSQALNFAVYTTVQTSEVNYLCTNNKTVINRLLQTVIKNTTKE